MFCFRFQFVALYDYDPFKTSPNRNPSLELAFREGDIMVVYDKSRSDGFYSAKVPIFLLILIILCINGIIFILLICLVVLGDI